ncbi:MAG: hypothetical protein HFH14_04245 [Lachnospiraceae bacterium]|nr:hypothetical protein [Lachnospiraceae bacterium]
MNISKKFAAAAALLIIIFIYSLPMLTAKAYESPDETAASVILPFTASIEYSSNGYVVMGTLTDFPSDARLVKTMYSTDGETFHPCMKDWDFHLLDTDDTGSFSKLQKQVCLYANFEPFKSYLQGSLDHFYVKLIITGENGAAYETIPVVIERGMPQPIPENLTAGASFTAAMAVIHTRPFGYYGRYQLTVSENSTAEDIAALLPDTIPVKISFYNGKNVVTDGVTDCPVKWKNLSILNLSSGESVTIEDAAEDIIVPGGTHVTTPTGIFILNEALNIDPLRINDCAPMDEIRLVLNVVSENDNLSGVLSADNDGLAMSFNRKPTGAANIRAYTLSEGDSKWTEIPNTTLIESVNSQPSTENSGYALIFDNNTEPYRSYLEAKNAGKNPTPFYVGVKIEGGVYDGRQLILAWPDTYELPYDIPDIAGQGGNEANAGAGNTGNATEGGQRPNLPQNPDDNPGAFIPETPLKTGGNDSDDGQRPEFSDNSDSGQRTEFSDKSNSGQRPEFSDNSDSGQRPELTDNNDSGQRPELPDNSDSGQRLGLSDNSDSGQRLGLSDNSSGQKPDSPYSNDVKNDNFLINVNNDNLLKANVDNIGQRPDAPYNPENKNDTYTDTAAYGSIYSHESQSDRKKEDIKTGSRIPYVPAMVITAAVCLAILCIPIYNYYFARRKNGRQY